MHINQEKIRPLNDRVVIKRDSSEEITKGGIIVPDIASKKSYFGVVVAVGPGKLSAKTGKRVPLDVKPGDHVCFGDYVDHDEQGYVIAMEADIRFILEH
jgi:chaperonin GroES